MNNELLFLAHSILISAFALGALRLGKSALAAFVCLLCVLANLFVTKQITLFGLNATCADSYTIGAVLGLNLLQEYYGKEDTKKTIWASFYLLVLYGIVTLIHLAYTPSSFDTMQLHCNALLCFMPRIVMASITAYLISQIIDYFLYGLLKTYCAGRYLVGRNYATLTVSQLVDTILFGFLGLYGLVENIWHVVAVSYAVKLIAIAVAVPIVGFSKKMMRDHK